MKIPLRSLGLIGLLSGLGGAINVGLLYVLGITVVSDFAVPEFPPEVYFPPEVSLAAMLAVLAGAAHGAVLASVSVAFAAWLWEKRRLVRWAGLLVVGWLSGLASGVPILLVWGRDWLPLSLHALSDLTLMSRVLMSSMGFVLVFVLPWFFGLVGMSYYACLNLCRLLPSPRLGLHLLLGTASGCLGSLFFWIKIANYGLWYVSLLHGTVWGSLVGFGVWKSQLAGRKLGASTTQ